MFFGSVSGTSLSVINLTAASIPIFHQDKVDGRASKAKKCRTFVFKSKILMFRVRK
jgi:hypothetical protein